MINTDFYEDGLLDDVTMEAVDPDLGDAIIYEGFDFYADDYMDSQRFTTRDLDGRPILVEEDYDGNGTVDQENMYTYDAEGRLLVYSEDFLMDGLLERLETYTYNAEGDLLTSEIDEDGDGIADITETYTYNVDGEVDVYRYDEDGDGVAERVLTYVTYDVDGNALLVEEDLDDDGLAEVYYVQTFENGELTTLNSYDATDDTLLSAASYTYLDAFGSLDYVSDDDGDGVDDYAAHITYDADGNYTIYWQDIGLNGVRDYEGTFEWSEDGYGLVSSIENYPDYAYGDDLVVTTATTYTAEGRLLDNVYDVDFPGYGYSIGTDWDWTCP